MFGQSPFANPIVTMQDLAQYQQQAQYNQQVNVYNQNPNRNQNMEEFAKLIGELTRDEQNTLFSSDEFVLAKQQYEASFMEYLSNKFGNEFLASDGGIKASERLLSTTKSSLDHIQYESSEKRKRLERLAEALEKNPELAEQLKI